ncbi:MAG TPA: hypothetical protein D7I07_07165 [Candidatus Poseidoniales archaeon]|nr:MAG TPA: hypothetical protein D7I07_07165 [Candidatus Poseidoniales archaeon]
MLTLFWLFFMSATFLIRIDVPDARSVAHDTSLEAAGESVLQYGIGLEAEVSGENRLTELLSQSAYDDACILLQEALIAGKEANCWLAKNSATANPYGLVGTPSGNTVTVHHLITYSENVWTVSLTIWNIGGGA